MTGGRNAAAVGLVFRSRRHDLGLTQGEVAAAARLSLPTVRKLEVGTHTTTVTRRAIAVALRWPEDAYDQISLGANPEDLDDTDSDPLGPDEGLAMLESTMRRMGLSSVDVEVMMAATKALVARLGDR